MKKHIALLVFVLSFSFVFTANSQSSNSYYRIFGDVSSDFLAHYKMNDNLADTNVIDSVGANTGTAARNTNLFSATGKIGLALDFDGADDKVNCASDFIGTQAVTICAWIYPQGWGEDDLGRVVDNAKTRFWLTTVDDTILFHSDGATNTTAAVNAIVLNTWTFVAVTRTTAGVANIYINGVLSGTANQDSGAPEVGIGNVFIGNASGATRTFNGLIDNLMIFSRVLSAVEILGLHENGRGTEALEGFVVP